MSDSIKDIIEEINEEADLEYERRREARKARVEAEKKRQLLYRKLFFGGIGVVLVAIIITIIAVSVSKAVKKNSQDSSKPNKSDNTLLVDKDIDEIDSDEQDSDKNDSDKNDSYGQLAINIFPVDLSQILQSEELTQTPSSNIPDITYNENGKLKQFELDAAEYVYTENASTSGVYYDGFYSQYAILIDVDSKDIICSMQGNAKMYPASMTKVMTVLTARQYISIEELDNLITITQDATDYAFSHGCAAVNFEVGEQVTLRDLFYGTILKSGADAAYMLAVYVAGSHEAFVDLMNENCVALGIGETTHFTNCVGIYDDMNYSSCHDIAVIMAATVKDEFLQELMNARRYTTSVTNEHATGIDISNLFLRRIEDFDTKGNVVAAKTGFVNQSGNCAVSFMRADDGRNFVCVTGHGNSAWQEVYDHIALYNIYAMNNTGYTGPVKIAK